MNLQEMFNKLNYDNDYFTMIMFIILVVLVYFLIIIDNQHSIKKY